MPTKKTIRKPKSPRRNTKNKRKSKNSNYKFWIVFAIISLLAFGFIGFRYKTTFVYYYAKYFDKKPHKTLTNNLFETKRIEKIVETYSNKTFGIDISHYQNREDIDWENLTIANGTIPLKFIVLRATMGTKSKDKHYQHYWKKAKKHQLIRGAYHFYRPNEDPVKQANNFISSVKLSEGDLIPILDIEKEPTQISNEKLIENLKIWLDIVEKEYGRKPIIYTFYHYYKDYLRGNFEDYPVWLANYNDVPEPSEEDQWKIWQFTENGIVQGIKTKVDLNIFNGSTSELKQLTIK